MDETLLVMLLPRADGRLVIPHLRDHQNVILVSFPHTKGEQQLLQALGKRLSGHVRREAPVAGFEQPWFASCRHLVTASIDAALDRLGESNAGVWVRRHRQLLINGLTIDTIAAISERNDMTAAVGGLPPGKILLACGTSSQFGFVKSLAQQGRTVTPLLATAEPAERAIVPIPDWQGAGSSSIDPSAASRSLERAIVAIRDTIKVPDVAGAAVVCADFRNRRDFRYVATARAISDAAQTRRPVRLLQQYNRFSRSVVSLSLGTALASLGRRRFALTRSPHRLGAPLPPVEWAGLFASVSRTAAEASAEFRNDLAAIDVVSAVAYRFALRRLTVDIAQAEAIRIAFSKRPPAWVALIPGSQPFAMNVASGARAAGVATLAIYTLLVGKSLRECRPIAEWIGCMDTAQVDHLVAYLGADRSRTIPIGNIDVDDWNQSAGTSGAKSERTTEQRRIAFIAQPVPELTRTALAWLIDAVSQYRDTRLDIYLHPDERRALEAEYEAVAKASKASDRIHVHKGGAPMDRVMDADVLATLDSNQGYKAGILGRRVLVVDPTTSGLPVSLDALGIAVRARTLEEVRETLHDLMEGRRDAGLAHSRAAYLAINPQLVNGRLGVRVTELAERAAAQKKERA